MKTLLTQHKQFNAHAKQFNTLSTRKPMQTQFKDTVRTTRKTSRKRGENSLVIQITTTKPMIEMVDRIMDTGLFGTSRAAAAERIMCEGVRIILKENPFIRIKKILI